MSIEFSFILLRVFNNRLVFSFSGKIDSLAVFLFRIMLLLSMREQLELILGERFEARRSIECFIEAKGEVGELVSVSDATVQGVDSYV